MGLSLDYVRGICACLLAGFGLLQMGALEAAQAYAQLSSLKTQIPASAAAATVIMDSVDAILNMDMDPKKESVIVKEDGTYFIMCVVQVGATDPKAQGFLDIWFMRNGKPIPNTGSRMNVQDGSWTGTLVVQAALRLSAGDLISSKFSASAPSLGCVFIKPPNAPAATSVSFSMLKLE